MEKVGNDEWTLSGITSTFRLEGLQKELLYTVDCGLGWKFAFSNKGLSNKGLSNKGLSNKEHPRLRKKSDKMVEIFFDPNRLRNADLDLSITVQQGYSPFSHRGVPLGLHLSTCNGRTSLGSYITPENTKDNRIFVINVSFPNVKLSLPTSTSVLPRARRALYQSLDAAQFGDTKFYLFSHRLMPSRSVSHPRALYANSLLLRGQSSYLDMLLFGVGFKEFSIVDLLTDSPPEMDPDGYDYESDSDLDSEPDTDIVPPPSVSFSPQGPPGSSSSSGNPYSPPIEPTTVPIPDSEDESVGNQEGHIGNPEGPFEQLERDIIPSGRASNASPTQRIDEPSPVDGESVYADEPTNVPSAIGPSGCMGRILAMNDTAFNTWRALVFYFYTEDMVFSPLKSEHLKLEERVLAMGDVATPACSPKSMYRLADKIGLYTLKDSAFNAIRSRLSENNIVDEVFSTFTSRYPQIQEMETDFLCANYYLPKVAKDFEKVLEKSVDGELAHRSDVMLMTLRKLLGRAR